MLASVFGVFSTAAFGQCTFTLNPATHAYVDSLGTIDQKGDPLVIQITASAQTCAWTADASDGFAVITGSSAGTGNGSVTYSIPANTTGLAQSVTLNIAGNAIPLTQDVTATTFADVLPSQFTEPLFDGINLLRANSITKGCLASPLSYCPAATVTRDQMAVFIVRTIMGGGPDVDNFSYTTTPYFTDVPANYQYFKWIQKLKDLGITSGTTPTTYSPQLAVTRGQMAVFIVRARLGAAEVFSYNPAPYFTDVPANYTFFRWIQKLKEIGITSGTTPTTYSPEVPVTRDEMAVFLVRAGFNDLLNPSAPIIMSLSPNNGATGQAVNVNVTGVNTHFAADTTVFAENGVTAGTPTIVDATHLTVTLAIPLNTTPGQISVTAQTPSASEEEATIPNGFTVNGAISITDFNPKSASAGTLVTVTGANLFPDADSAAQFTLASQGGGTLTGFASSATPTSITFVIPAGAATGIPSIVVNGLTANAATPLVIVPPSTFTLNAAPGAASVFQGQSVGVAVSLASTTGFHSLAALSIGGVPSGVTAVFNPSGITAGQTSVLTLTAPGNQPIATSALSISAAAAIGGIPMTQTSGVSLSVVAPTTSFLGRTVVSDARPFLTTIPPATSFPRPMVSVIRPHSPTNLSLAKSRPSKTPWAIPRPLHMTRMAIFLPRPIPMAT